MRVLFRSFYPRLCFLAEELTNNEAQAQDMAQESLSSFWQKREGFKDASLKEVSAFLFTVVRNRSFNYLKHLKVREAKHKLLADRLDEFDAEAEARFIKEDLYNRIYREIQQLPDAQRRLLSMIFVEGLETHEIAAALGTTPNNVRNQKARALEKLRSVLLKKHLSLAFFYFFINSL